jgi:predicted DNA-binding helix-hairpin-helix protein
MLIPWFEGRIRLTYKIICSTIIGMEPMQRLMILSSQMHFEPAEDYKCPQIHQRKQDAIVVSSAALPNGKRINMLKTLLTSVCERDCLYCPFRADRDFRRATFKPDEFAQVFIALYTAGIVQGLFLSSGIINGGLRTQDQLLDTATILRDKLGYKGYLHLKIMPGAEFDQVAKAMTVADRVSINLEAPNPVRLGRLAPHKEFNNELLKPLGWIEQIRSTQPTYRGWNGRWPSSVTQFVVGAAEDTDLEILSTTQYLYQHLHLQRTYYSAFNPVPGTPLENQPPTSSLREHRLYESAFLLRDYGFAMEELPFDSDANLPLDKDPKLSWAMRNLVDHPIEINQAERLQLLRIPGIGPKSANAILKARRQGRFIALENLQKLGINTKRLAPFILINGKRPIYQSSYL